MKKIAPLFCHLLMPLIGHISVSAAEINYSAISPNVSYGDVLSLPYRIEDEVHHYGKDLHQFARLWLPPTKEPVSRLIVFIHGGCWLNEFDMSHTYPLATALSQEGYAVWSLEYRRTGDKGGGWPGSFDDIKQGIAFATSMENHGLNSTEFAIVGHSAGGHLALLAGLAFPQARTVIGLAAISDIEKYSLGDNDCETATPRFMGGTYAEQSSLYNLANPAYLGTSNSTILLHGTADSIVDINQASIEGATTKIEEGAGHFDWVHPGTPATQLLLKTLESAF